MRKSNYTFGQLPNCTYRRNSFDCSYSHKMTMNVGYWYPVYCQPVQPGDSFKCTADFVSQCTSSFVRPLMDNLFVDMYFFYIPYRLVMNDWEKVVAGAEPSDYSAPVEVQVPTLVSSSMAVENSVADCLGLPTGIKLPAGIANLRFRALAQVYNDWLRDENVFQSVVIDKRSATSATDTQLNGNAWSPSNYMGMLPPAAKLKDYFTSALRAPQKGGSVTVPIIGDGWVRTVGQDREITGEGNTYPLHMSTVNGSSPGTTVSLAGSNGFGEDYMYEVEGYAATPTGSGVGLYPLNLQLDSSTIEGTTINALRLAFQEQRYLERLAINGGRYQEYLKSMFGVTAGDSRLQMAELLGGMRMPMSVQQVAQTSQSSESAPLAQLGAFSLSGGRCGYVKGFVEHGVVIGVATIRQFHTYQQGVERDWFRTSRFDFYNPLFATLGFQPIYTKEIYAGDATLPTNPQQILGYTEAFGDLRFRQSLVTGQMRNNSKTSQKEWALADYYANAPTLTQSFLQETNDNLVDRLTVSPKSQDPFVFDWHFTNIKQAVMPMFGMPGLIDHH